ncbi:MAG TPA: trypsin-like peptidase domain-containing protein [Candidatus Angelobacter sp.]|nr:trypsin-like peptidase domain-containing protein [Candidatus Angelobacter sp.]
MPDKIWAAVSSELATTTATAGKSVVAVLGRRHPSSGILFRPDAIVTASHALRRDDEITVITGPGQKLKAQLAGRDAGTDIAVLRLEHSLDALPAAWSSTSNLRVGELVLALGRTWRGNITASSGILSGLVPGPWRTWRNGELDQFIRPDLTLYPGFSGGPLVASSGEFLGLNTAGLHRSGITIPANTVQRVAAELLEKGAIERPYLGLGMQPVALPESLRSKLNLTGSDALMVAHLDAGGPADKAGVLLGDLLIELGSHGLQEIENVQNVLRSAKAGQEIETKLIRAGAVTTLKIKVEARPAR